MDVTLRKYMTYIVILIFGLWIGFYIGAEYASRFETKTVIEQYSDAGAGKEAMWAKREAAGLDAQIGKVDFSIRGHDYCGGWVSGDQDTRTVGV